MEGGRGSGTKLRTLFFLLPSHICFLLSLFKYLICSKPIFSPSHTQKCTALSSYSSRGICVCAHMHVYTSGLAQPKKKKTQRKDIFILSIIN